jgi:hypothetical protein
VLLHSCISFEAGSYDILDLLVGLADIDELGLEGSTTNKETVNVVGLG